MSGTTCTPQVLRHRTGNRPKISVILIDWGVRESFHSLRYLNEQTVPRDEYELIWLEFYDRKPAALCDMVNARTSLLDKWYVLGYPDDMIFHKHRLYNAGLLAAQGEVCVICDSDAIFRPTFIENLIRAFEETPRAVVHLDEVRNNDRCFYPFNYPSIAEILPGCFNWQGRTTTGLSHEHDRIHNVNYGACMAARKRDLLAVGGADEHIDYLGYVCGPYDLTFRLVNYHGRPERWLQNEFLYHTWHPNTSGINGDYQGPHDGRHMSLRSLDARASFRIRPYLHNPFLAGRRRSQTSAIHRFFEYLRTHPEPDWKVGAQPAAADVYWADRAYQGFNLFVHRDRWYAVPERIKSLDPRKVRRGGYRLLLEADSREDLQAEIAEHAEPIPGVVGRFRRRFFAQPLHSLPVRAWRKSRRLLASLQSQSPW